MFTNVNFFDEYKGIMVDLGVPFVKQLPHYSLRKDTMACISLLPMQTMFIHIHEATRPIGKFAHCLQWHSFQLPAYFFRISVRLLA
jgi:hypothetical protein